ncbi:MAG: hypothetical protein ACTSVD_00760 [Candidatus Thorarchaeota archaeon]
MRRYVHVYDSHYSDTYTDTHRVYRYAETDYLSGVDDFSLLPQDLRELIIEYYGTFWLEIKGEIEPDTKSLESLAINYTRNYYYEAEWVVDPDTPPGGGGGGGGQPEPGVDHGGGSRPDLGDRDTYSARYFTAYQATSGHWEYGPNTFCGGTYSGVVVFSGDGTLYDDVCVNVTASGSELNSVDSVSLNQIGAGGVSPIPEPYKFASMLLYCAAFVHWLMGLLVAISEGVLPVDFLVGLIGAWLNAATMDALRLAGLAITIQILLHVIDAEIVQIIKDWGKPRMIWGVIGVAFYFSIIAIMWIVWIQYLEISLSLFMER